MNHGYLNFSPQDYSYTSNSTSYTAIAPQYNPALQRNIPIASVSSSVNSHNVPSGVSSISHTTTQSNDTPLSEAAVRSRIHLRKAAGKIWNDPTLDEWDANDFRVFCGDLGNEVTDELLSNAFRQYKSFQAARVIRDKRTGKGRGYGFVSFRDPHDMLRALKEMDRRYVGNRPIRVMKSQWKGRELDAASKKRVAQATGVAPNNSKVFKKFKLLKKPVNESSGSTTTHLGIYSSNNWEQHKEHGGGNALSEKRKKPRACT